MKERGKERERERERGGGREGGREEGSEGGREGEGGLFFPIRKILILGRSLAFQSLIASLQTEKYNYDDSLLTWQK